MTGQRASPLVAPASGLLWLTYLGVCFLEPGLPKMSSPHMTQCVTRRRTRPHGTLVPEILILPLGPKTSSQAPRIVRIILHS